MSFYFATEGRSMAPGSAGFLGSRYAAMELYTSMVPENIRRLDGISDLDHKQRGELRDLLSKQFARADRRRASAATAKRISACAA